MHITSLVIDNLPPLREFEIELDARVNLFVGPNASGKSTILRALNSIHSSLARWLSKETGFITIDTKLSGDIGLDTILGIYLFVSDDWPRPTDEDPTSGYTIPISHIPATRVGLNTRNIFDETFPIDRTTTVQSETPLTELFGTDSRIFYGQDVESAIGFLRGVGNPLERSQQNQFRRALAVGYSCAKAICFEVIHDDAPHPFVEADEHKDSGKVIYYGMGIGTNDNLVGEPLYAGALSSGTQGTLLWIYALALKMAHHYDWQEGWEKKPAILLIDEIENHLHPTWQRRVIPALLEHFTGLQIFATTHSPFVVAGLKAGQVHLLRRDENGGVTASTNTEDVVGWTTDEILRTMMGVEDPTDAETAAAARELRQLRNEAPRDDPEHEKQRQERIQELRQLVDRDLLAGGPMAAQRELFEEQFAEALKKYQQSRDLNQENR